MAIVYLKGLLASAADGSYSLPIGFSQLGTLVIDDIYFPAGFYETYDYDLQAFTLVPYPDFQIQSGIISVSQSKEIVRNKCAGRDGTVQEFMSFGDFEIRVTGKLTEKFQVFPADQLNAWKQVSKSKSSILVISKFLNLNFDINDVTIETFEVSTIALELLIPLFKEKKALIISAETLSASRAVSTKYIRLIISCRGSLGIDISLSYF
jgi:hypothetical protein